MEFGKYIVLIAEPEKVLRSDTGWSQQHLVFLCTSWALLWATCSISNTNGNMLTGYENGAFILVLSIPEAEHTGRLIVLKSSGTRGFFGWCNGWVLHGNQSCVQFVSRGDGNSLLLDFTSYWDICISKSVIYTRVYGPKMNVETKYASFYNAILYIIAIFQTEKQELFCY